MVDIPDWVHLPSPVTLAKYGLTLDEWAQHGERYGWVCPICSKPPTKGKWVVDHEHVLRFKNMEPGEKKKYVRGITCVACNHWYLARGLTASRAKNVWHYLRDYQARRDD